MENRPPGALSDPDLIVGILGDDKLVKVMPDVSVRGHVCVEDYGEEDVEIVEVFADMEDSCKSVQDKHEGQFKKQENGVNEMAGKGGDPVKEEEEKSR